MAFANLQRETHLADSDAEAAKEELHRRPTTIMPANHASDTDHIPRPHKAVGSRSGPMAKQEAQQSQEPLARSAGLDIGLGRTLDVNNQRRDGHQWPTIMRCVKTNQYNHALGPISFPSYARRMNTYEKRPYTRFGRKR